VLGGDVRCARRDDGRVRCWGAVNGGIAASPVELPVQDVVDVGISASLAGWIWIVTADGTLSVTRMNKPFAFAAVATGIRDIEPLDTNSVAAIRSDGALVRATLDAEATAVAQEPYAGVADVTAARNGYFNDSILHGGGQASRLDGDAWVPVPDLDDAVTLGASSSKEMCARRKSGAMRCWNDRGKPTADDGRTDVAQIAGADNAHHRCERTDAGVVRCRGENRMGQLGTGARSAGYVEELTEVALPAPAIDVVIAYRGSCAILADGDVACWGYNALGTIGDGTLIDRPAPVRVAGLLEDPAPPVRDGLDAVGQAAQAMDWSGLPKKCTKPGEATDLDRTYPFQVVSAYAFVTDSTELVVNLADFQIDVLDEWAAPRGPQRALRVSFRRFDRDGLSVFPDVGRYQSGRETDRRVDLSFAVGAKSWFWALGDADRARIAYLDRTWVCGTVDLPDASGKDTPHPFAARIVRPD
jgi:hypothetical protein